MGVGVQVKQKYTELEAAGIKVGAKEVRAAQQVSVSLQPLALLGISVNSRACETAERGAVVTCV